MHMLNTNTEELLKRVRRVEIKTRALSSGVFAGEYHSAFKGRGMSFAEVREYRIGDDVRDIDRNVTARLGRPHVKVYEEERELTVMLVVDISGSTDFGSGETNVRTLLAEMAATLAFSAGRTGDKVGLLLFSSGTPLFLPAGKGRSHTLRIIRELLEYTPESRETNLNEALEYLMRVVCRRAIVFVMSDFLGDTNYADALRQLARKHDVAAIRIEDPRTAELPNVGLMRVCDAETGHELLLDTASAKVRRLHAERRKEHVAALDDLLKRQGIDHVSVMPGDDYVKALMRMFARRGRH